MADAGSGSMNLMDPAKLPGSDRIHNAVSSPVWRIRIQKIRIVWLNTHSQFSPCRVDLTDTEAVPNFPQHNSTTHLDVVERGSAAVPSAVHVSNLAGHFPDVRVQLLYFCSPYL